MSAGVFFLLEQRRHSFPLFYFTGTKDIRGAGGSLVYFYFILIQQRTIPSSCE